MASIKFQGSIEVQREHVGAKFRYILLLGKTLMVEVQPLSRNDIVAILSNTFVNPVLINNPKGFFNRPNASSRITPLGPT
jgi:hypothetical protein